MSTALTLPNAEAKAIESALISGDLSKLSVEQRLSYYNRTCESLGLNPLTAPFAYIMLNGKLQLYAKRDATEQLRKINGVSITKLDKMFQNDLYIVTADATDKMGRSDSSTGAVSIAGLKGENLANALMKAETKAKRRVTLSICGLGLLDETEVASIPGAHEDAEVLSPDERKAVVERKIKELKEPPKDEPATEADEIERWKNVISCCITAADFNAMIPQVKDKPNVIKMALMTEAVTKGFKFDREVKEFASLYPESTTQFEREMDNPPEAYVAPISAPVSDDGLMRIVCHVSDVEKRKKKAGGDYWLLQCDVDGANDTLAVQVWDAKLFDAAMALLGKDATLGCKRKETADKVFYSLEVIY